MQGSSSQYDFFTCYYTNLVACYFKQFAKNVWLGLVGGSLITDLIVTSSNPGMKLRKKTKKTVVYHISKFLGCTQTIQTIIPS